MVNDYTGTPHGELQNTIQIVEICLLAGKPDQIVTFLRRELSAEQVEALLAANAKAEAPPATRAPERPAATTRATAPSFGSDERLVAAVERRFRAQNKRPV